MAPDGRCDGRGASLRTAAEAAAAGAGPFSQSRALRSGWRARLGAERRRAAVPVHPKRTAGVRQATGLQQPRGGDLTRGLSGRY
jgi:hypothetical protein